MGVLKIAGLGVKGVKYLFKPGTGSAVSTAAKVGFGYAAWDKLFGDGGLSSEVKEGGLLGVAGKVAVGEKRAEHYGDFIDRKTGFKADDTQNQNTQQNGQGYGDPNDPYAQQYNDVQGMMNSTFQPSQQQSPMSSLSNFFSNMMSGNMSMGSYAGLFAGLWLMFSRFGMWGKIGGALLSMMMIGNNSQSQQVAPAQQMNNGIVQDMGYGGGMHR